MMTKSPFKEAIFYIKYYAQKHDCIIERKATLNEDCFEGVHKTKGYAYKKYVDLDQTEQLGNDKEGKPQIRCASKSWEINPTRTIS